MRRSGLAIYRSHAFELQPCIQGKASGTECAPRGPMRAEEGQVDLIHGGPLPDVGQHDGTLHHLLHRGAVTVQDGGDVEESLSSLRPDSSGHQVSSAVGSELPGEVQHIPNPYRLGKWE